jgi:hypothetical protein
MANAPARVGTVPRIGPARELASGGLSPELALGRYRPLRPLGSGGSGSVWLARDERTGLDVALKIVPLEGKAGDRAEREAEACARLRHPACLRAYAFGRERGHVYIAYEYAPGKTFRETLRAGQLRDADAVEACAQVADALAHAHSRRILHRDVKPANVLLVDAPSISVRLLDFGLAALDDAPTLTAQGDVPGTLAYISPERLMGGPSTSAADVWAVGVMLWEALAGRHPFTRPSLRETGDAIEAGAPPLASVRPDLPSTVTDAVDRALALDPRRRPSAAQLADALRSLRPRRAPRSTSHKLLPAPRLAQALAAGAYAGTAATLLPFWPTPFPQALAAAAAGLAFFRPKLGMAFALAAAVFPVGNLSVGLAIAYAVVAIAWLALSSRRAVVAATAVLLVYGTSHPPDAAVARVEDPLAAARAVVAGTPSEAWRLALVAGFAVAGLRFVRSLWHVSFWGAGLIAAALLANPSVAALPVIALVWAACVGLAVRRAA